MRGLLELVPAGEVNRPIRDRGEEERPDARTEQRFGSALDARARNF